MIFNNPLYIREGYCLTDTKNYKKFIVLSSIVNTGNDTVSKVFYGNGYKIPFTLIDKSTNIKKIRVHTKNSQIPVFV